MDRPRHPASDRLELLYRLAQTFNASLDLDEVLNLVLDEVIAAIQAERGVVVLKEHGDGLVFRAARGMDQRAMETPEFEISRGVVENVVKSRQPTLTSDAQADVRFNLRQSVISLGLRSILCVPLIVKEQVLGAIYVDNRLQSGIFIQEDLDLLSAIASSASIAIENARLYQVAVEKGRLEREMQIAHRVQASLLPQEIPPIPGWQLAARWQPAREVAGDYYDFIPLDNGKLGILIADVTDKGIPAALFMAFTRTIVRASLGQETNPAEGITRANELICAESSYGFFVTLFYACLDTADGKLTYVNAGHNPPFVCQQSEPGAEPTLHKLPLTGIPIGIEERATFEDMTVQMNPGDCLVLYTDGVTEALDPQNEFFGMERLRNAILQYCSSSAADILSGIDAALADFAGESQQGDDITLVVIKRL